MSRQSVSRAIRDVTAALDHPLTQRKWLRFPQTRQERDAIKRRFYKKFHIPAVLGCIDGTHVAIIRPVEHEERYFNRKHFHSRNVMIICDADLRILAVDSSVGGASHDSAVLRQNPINQHLIDLVNNLEDVYLLGDSGYAQREYMMTPIVNAAAGSPEEYYTKLQCTARNVVERTIGVLKNRWRCLLRHRVLHYQPHVASKIINACCILHNMCIDKEVDLEEPIVDDDQDSPEQPQDSGSVNSSSATAELHRGIQKRAALVRQLWAHRR